MSKKYGRVFRVHGLFGVRHLSSLMSMRHNLIPVQAEQLYVSDPRALHHIVVKVRLTSHLSFVMLMLTLSTRINPSTRKRQCSPSTHVSIVSFIILTNEFDIGVTDSSLVMACYRLEVGLHTHRPLQLLISSQGDDHKRQRKLLNPAFSAAHLRQLVPIFYPITYQVRELTIHPPPS